jgi:hypothetical protein
MFVMKLHNVVILLVDSVLTFAEDVNKMIKFPQFSITFLILDTQKEMFIKLWYNYITHV